MELNELLSKCDQGFMEVEFTTEYLPTSGFFVKMRPMDRELELEFNRKCKEMKFDPKSHQRIEVFNDEKFAALADEKLLVDWRGLTPRIANILIPTLKVGSDIDLDAEVPCSPEAKRALMGKSKDFAKFILALALDAGQVKANLVEEEQKNLKSSQSGKHQDAPSPANNAAS